jgi:coproporphyrinogen III oxidase
LYDAANCHNCIELYGSYTCQCDEYYMLDPATNKTCIGGIRKGSREVFFY